MPATSGDTVRVHYTGTLADGSQFDSSEGREPLEFTIGGGQVIPGFDKAVQGLEPGETRTVTIPSEEAYGPHRDEMVLRAGRDQLPEGMDPEVGNVLMLQTDAGHQLPARVVEMDENTLTLDANHELAGEDLTFELTLTEIV